MKNWTEWFRIITPVLLALGLFILTSIEKKIDGLDEKMFKHVTNDEIHTPKSIVLSKAEFTMYQQGQYVQMNLIQDNVNRRIDNLARSIDKAIEALSNGR